MKGRLCTITNGFFLSAHAGVVSFDDSNTCKLASFCEAKLFEVLNLFLFRNSSFKYQTGTLLSNQKQITIIRFPLPELPHTLLLKSYYATNMLICFSRWNPTTLTSCWNLLVCFSCRCFRRPSSSAVRTTTSQSPSTFADFSWCAQAA